jgi:hypothetical protein
MVGLAWTAAALQVDVGQRWPVRGPIEVTVALRNTKGATPAVFAEGWAEPGSGLGEIEACLEDHLLLRWEADEMINPESFALDLGDRMEQAFGTLYRRHIARIGEYADRFDPRLRVF